MTHSNVNTLERNRVGSSLKNLIAIHVIGFLFIPPQQKFQILHP